MSWSLPRLYLRPHWDSSSSEESVSRPLFCTAIFRRMEAFGSSMQLQPVGHGAIAAVAGSEIARHAADGGHADARLLVDLTVGQSAFEQLHHSPAVRHRLQLGRRA